jgi:hypothetical protein
MNWKNGGIWLVLLIPMIGVCIAMGVNASHDIVSLLLLAIIVILLIIRWKIKPTHKD